MLLIAEQRLLDYKAHPDVLYYHSSRDPEMEGIELIKALPLSKIKLRFVEPYKIIISSPHKASMYFELCNHRLSTNWVNKVWCEWTNLIDKIARGVPLTARHTPEESYRTPIYTLYTSDEGLPT